MSMHLLIDLSIIEMHLNVRLFFAGVANRRHVPPGNLPVSPGFESLGLRVNNKKRKLGVI